MPVLSCWQALPGKTVSCRNHTHFSLLLNAPGEETVVTIYLSRSAFDKGRMYKYDPVNAEWLDYSEYAEFSSNRREVHLTLKDGGFGDADGLENGIIVDPLAFGSESDPNSGSDFFAEMWRITFSSRPGGRVSCSTSVTKPCSYSRFAKSSMILS